MDLLRRNFGKLFILVLVGGLVAGVLMAKKNVQLDLGTYNGRKIELTTKSNAPTGPQIITSTTTFAPGAAVTGTMPLAGAALAAGQTLGIPAAGTVDSINGKTITLIGTDGTTVKAVVSDTTTFANNLVITTTDLKAGDQVTVIGQGSADGLTITATQMTVGSLPGAATAFVRPGGGAGPGPMGGTSAAPGAGRASGAGQPGGFTTVSGAIQKVDGNTVTVAVEGGQPVKVVVTPDTRLRKVASATLSDIKTGAQVTIIGTAGTDGAVAAISVQLGSTR